MLSIATFPHLGTRHPLPRGEDLPEGCGLIHDVAGSLERDWLHAGLAQRMRSIACALHSLPVVDTATVLVLPRTLL